MAIAVGTAVTAQSKTSGTTLALGTFGTLATGDIVVVSFGCDQTAGAYSIAHTGTASITWTDQGTQSKSGSQQHTLFTGKVTTGGTCTAVTVTHPTLVARAMSGIKVTGGNVVTGYNGQSVASSDPNFKANSATQWTVAGWAKEAIYIGGISAEGPNGDTWTAVSPGTVTGKIGTTASAASSNITTGLVYKIYATAPPADFDLAATGSVSRWWSGAGVKIETTVSGSSTIATTRFATSCVGIKNAARATLATLKVITSASNILRPTDPYGGVIFDDAPVAWWRLPETPSNGGVVADYMKTANGAFAATTAATAGGGGVPPTNASGGVIDGISNANAGVRVTNNVSIFEKTGGAPFSVELWYQPTAIPWTNGFPGLVTFHTGANGWQIYGNSTDSKLRAGVGTQTLTPATQTVASGGIYHIVLTYDGTNGRLYQNNVLIAGPLAMTEISGGATTLTIGIDRTLARSSEGEIGEVAFYDYTLTAAQVTAHYDAGNATAPSASSATSATTKVITSATGVKGAARATLSTLQLVSTSTGQKAASGSSLSTLRVVATITSGKSAAGSVFITFRPVTAIASNKGAQSSTLATTKLTTSVAASKGGQGATLSTFKVVTSSAGTKAATSTTLATFKLLTTISSRKASSGSALITFRPTTTIASNKSARSSTATTFQVTTAVTSNKGAQSVELVTYRIVTTAAGEKGASVASLITTQIITSATGVGSSPPSISGSAYITARIVTSATGIKNAQGSAALLIKAVTSASGQKGAQSSTLAIAQIVTSVAGQKAGQGSVLVVFKPTTSASGSKGALSTTALSTRFVVTTTGGPPAQGKSDIKTTIVTSASGVKGAQRAVLDTNRIVTSATTQKGASSATSVTLSTVTSVTSRKDGASPVLITLKPTTDVTGRKGAQAATLTTVVFVVGTSTTQKAYGSVFVTMQLVLGTTAVRAGGGQTIYRPSIQGHLSGSEVGIAEVGQGGRILIGSEVGMSGGPQTGRLGAADREEQI